MAKKVMRKSAESTDRIRTGAAYIRVSTDDQLEYSPESQLEEIKRYCLQHNILLPSEYIFVEEDGRSGRKSSNRYAFRNMIARQRPSRSPSMSLSCGSSAGLPGIRTRVLSTSPCSGKSSESMWYPSVSR